MRKEQAQTRADRIRSFQGELTELEREGVVTLSDDQRRRLMEHHERLLRSLAKDHDIDTSSAQKQMSLGMRIVSVLGAAAISAAVFFFFFRIWGHLTTPYQVAILVLAPLLATTGVEIAARKEKTLSFAAIIGLVAFACFVLNLSVLGQIFNITPTQNAFLAWAVFAFVLAYSYGLRILLVAGILSLTGYLSATAGTWSGWYWLSFGERPENFIAAGLILFGISFLPHRSHPEFPPYYRVFGLLAVFISILILSHWGRISYLAVPPRYVEYVYQVAGFAAAGLAMWMGIHRQWTGITNLGGTFFSLFLYTKFYDWWWEWMPKYLFFLILGLVAILILLVLKRLRALSQEARA
jgi:uncharacterized membrane protein